MSGLLIPGQISIGIMIGVPSPSTRPLPISYFEGNAKEKETVSVFGKEYRVYRPPDRPAPINGKHPHVLLLEAGGNDEVAYLPSPRNPCVSVTRIQSPAQTYLSIDGVDYTMPKCRVLVTDNGIYQL